MFKFDNTHIFTGYLKQLLSSVHIPTCKIYTQEFANYRETHDVVEDPRVLASFDTLSRSRLTSSISYLKNNQFYNYFWDTKKSRKHSYTNCYWRKSSDAFYAPDSMIPGLTKVLHSPGIIYDSITHEYLGDFLRFLRDYYNVNLMSMYNCFNNKIYNNIYYEHRILADNPDFDQSIPESSANPAKIVKTNRVFDSRDSRYHIYAFPVKLFSNYTIAIDSDTGIEMFCSFYNKTLTAANDDKAADLATRTYQKIGKTTFNKPFLYKKLDVSNWNFENEAALDASGSSQLLNNKKVSSCDIAAREHDLRLFIKVPVSCKSSIVVLEGDYRYYNNYLYAPDEQGILTYRQNHCVLNFENDVIDNPIFKPISKLQLLAMNTGESYPFANRLVEFLCASAITPIDEIPDNIKRVQKVMSQNGYYFNILGRWDNKMQKLIYDYMVNTGPYECITLGNDRIADPDKVGEIVDAATYKYKTTTKLVDKRAGYHTTLGHTAKSTLYDITGFVDKEAEKWYASWVAKNNEAVTQDRIQTVDIYDGLFDI